jgi:hypothetical protein
MFVCISLNINYIQNNIYIVTTVATPNKAIFRVCYMVWQELPDVSEGRADSIYKVEEQQL